MLTSSTKALSASRASWLALMCVAFGMEGVALAAQYAWGLQPCNECVYVRFWVLALALLGGLGALVPKTKAVRTVLIAATLGALTLALTHAQKLFALEQKVAAGGAVGCGYFKGFALKIPLAEWLPSVFEPRGLCGELTGLVLGQSFAVWTLVGLGCVLAAVGLVLARDLTRA